MKTILRAFVILTPLLIPSAASAAWSLSFTFGNGNACPNALCAFGAMLIGLINGVLVPLLFAVAFIMFLYGIAKAYIFSGGEADAVAQGHRLILWGLIGFAVMISIWGLVNVVASTFGLGGATAPPLPTSF
ncbi:MAG TPA: hypothetical protein VFP46_02325 [Candidatus Paceibacterota bacterium]|nr:hypothetical protein [Candidatus Paceibacterota bacterium]